MTRAAAHAALDEFLTAAARRKLLWSGLQSGVTDRAPFDVAVARVDFARQKLEEVVRETVKKEARCPQ